MSSALHPARPASTQAGALLMAPRVSAPMRSPEGAAAGAGFVCSFAADAQGNASIRNALLNPKVQVPLSSAPSV